MLEQVKSYTDFTDETDVLTEIQHYGGKTNLIDFTTDYLIALFFACDGSSHSDGRVILLNKNSNQGNISSPKKNQNNRVISQKSIFFQSPKGYLDQEDSAVEIIPIPQELKPIVLDYLRTYHGVATHTIYNDIFGYIQNQEKHQTAYTAFFIGLTSSKKGKYEEAIKHYDESISNNPQAVSAYVNRGASKAQLGRHDEAIADYDQAIRITPYEDAAYFNRGNSKLDLGLHDEAIADYDQVIRITPSDARAYCNRGDAKSKLGRYEEAMVDYNEGLRINPHDVRTYNNRGIAKGELGRYEEAITDFNQAIRIDPQNSAAYKNRGNSHGKLGRYKAAIADYDEGIRICPDVQAYCNRGWSYKAMGEYEKARADLKHAFRLATEEDNQTLAQTAQRLLDELPP